jgi:hypothetical protein
MIISYNLRLLIIPLKRKRKRIKYSTHGELLLRLTKFLDTAKYKKRRSFMMQNKHKMFLSGLVGFSFFLIANFTNLFTGLNILSGCLQLVVNAFVFWVWLGAFTTSHGLTRFIAFWGVVFPFIMGTITIIRVLLPALTQAIK